MKIKLLLTATLIFSILSADAQYKWDVGIKIGGSNYLGDIGGQEAVRRDFIWDIHLDDTRMNYSIFARRKLNKRWALAMNADYVSIWGFDINSLNPPRVARNANFRNRIYEIGGRAELTLFYDNDVGGRGYYNPDWRFFIFAGLAGFNHNPQVQIFNGAEWDASSNSFVKIDPDYKGTWNNVRALRTENQEEEYERFGLAIPVGAGMYFTFDKRWRFGWELNWRTTFTDYLDDVSTQYGDINEINDRGDIASEIAQQSSSATVSYANSLPGADIENDGIPNGGSIADHQWSGYTTTDTGELVPISVKRGDPTHNDDYITMSFTASYVIRGTSSFYRAKYSWLKQRRGSRRSRAKF